MRIVKKLRTPGEAKHWSVLVLRDGSGSGDSRAFLDGVNFVHGYIFKFFEKAARPANFDPVDFCCCAQTEVDAHVAIGIKARAAAHLVDKEARAGLDSNARADAVAIGFCT